MNVKTYDPTSRWKNAIERVEKMAVLKHVLTDKEKLHQRRIKSPNTAKMPFMAVCDALRCCYYFDNEKQLERFKKHTPDIERYRFIKRAI